MQAKEVLVIGAGIAGCAVALALAKRGIAVSMMTSSLDQRAYHASFIQHECLEEKIRELQQSKQKHLICSRAHEQLATLVRESINEFLESNDLIDRNGNIDIHRCLQERIKEHANIEMISNYTLIELLTLDRHSPKKSDCYKKPTCIGVHVYNHQTHQIERFLAKEIILATGGAASLFLNSTHPRTACGEGLAIAHRAGARLLNMNHVQFHPIGLFEKENPCFPLPLALLSEEGAQLYASKTAVPIELSSPKELIKQMYEQHFKLKNAHLCLDLTGTNIEAIKERFSRVDTYCLNRGFNLAKDQLPVVPVVNYTCGGIAIDRVGQTNVQRLRAIGDVSCTGLFFDFKDETLSVLESLTWAVACAEDIAKQLTKLIYYFPELQPDSVRLEIKEFPFVQEDWDLMRQIMWSYVGIKRDKARLERACVLLNQLHQANFCDDFLSSSLEHIQFCHAIQIAQSIVQASLDQCKIGNKI